VRIRGEATASGRMRVEQRRYGSIAIGWERKYLHMSAAPRVSNRSRRKRHAYILQTACVDTSRAGPNAGGKKSVWMKAFFRRPVRFQAPRPPLETPR